MAEIKRSKGRVILIDDEDLEEVKRNFPGACLSIDDKLRVKIDYHLRARGKTIWRYRIPLHQYLMTPVAPLVVDHINRNPLDNRRCNLRLVTQAENRMNTLPRPDSCISMTSYGAWQVIVGHQGRPKYIGAWPTIEEAREKRNEWMRAHRGRMSPV